MRKEIFIGTSGYSYPHWKKVFYPKGCGQNQWLEYYARFFTSLELKVTFSRWYGSTPEGFAFLLKGSRHITHIRRLPDCRKAVDLFLARAAGLKEKLRSVLWQLPPSLENDPALLESFLARPGPRREEISPCFEFRHKSWFTDETFSLLKKEQAGLCISDFSDPTSAEEITSYFTYLRFHGGKSIYDSRYSPGHLKKWVDKTLVWLDNIRTLFVFFNNDARGYAVKNALQFKQLLDERI